MQTGDRFQIGELELFGPPNPALANILLGTRMKSVVAKYTVKVLSVYLNLQAAETYRDLARYERGGANFPREPGQLMQQTEASVDVGSARPGMAADRWVGQITVGVEYAGAEIYGRKSYAQYKGNYNLQQAMHTVFPSQT